MDVLISDEKGFFSNRELGAFRRAVLKALRALGVGGETELSITFTGDCEMRELNWKYRAIKRTTDVLSFPQGGEHTAGGGGMELLGDVVISVDAARRNAQRYEESLGAEVLRLIVHGTLHLLGYDHKRASDRARMKAKEDEILKAIGRGLRAL